MASGYEGRLVIVTGGTGALGSAVVGRLLREGAVCRVPVFDDRELERFEAKDDSRVEIVRGMDLADEAKVAALFEGAGALWASVHIAGGFLWAPIADTSAAQYRQQLEMNLTTCFLCCREAVKAMRASGRGGRIVNVASRPALEPRTGANMTAYTAAKAGVAGLTQALAEEAAGDGILVNAVAPSIMDTAQNRAAMPDADHAKWPTVEEVAATVVWLASPENTVTRGGVVPVYGRA